MSKNEMSERVKVPDDLDLPRIFTDAKQYTTDEMADFLDRQSDVTEKRAREKVRPADEFAFV